MTLQEAEQHAQNIQQAAARRQQQQEIAAAADADAGVAAASDRPGRRQRHVPDNTEELDIEVDHEFNCEESADLAGSDSDYEQVGKAQNGSASFFLNGFECSGPCGMQQICALKSLLLTNGCSMHKGIVQQGREWDSRTAELVQPPSGHAACPIADINCPKACLMCTLFCHKFKSQTPLSCDLRYLAVQVQTGSDTEWEDHDDLSEEIDFDSDASQGQRQNHGQRQSERQRNRRRRELQGRGVRSRRQDERTRPQT